LENIFVGAKHDLRQYEIITNNLYAVMLRPLHKLDVPKAFSDFIPVSAPASAIKRADTAISCQGKTAHFRYDSRARQTIFFV
jgi:hypothetical protein